MNRLSEWIDHRLKRARWPASRAARAAAIVLLALLLIGVYVVQSSQIALTTRHVEILQQQVGELRRANARRLVAIALKTSAARMQERATALGFVPAEGVDFIVVSVPLRDDAPSLQDGYPVP